MGRDCRRDSHALTKQCIISKRIVHEFVSRRSVQSTSQPNEPIEGSRFRPRLAVVGEIRKRQALLILVPNAIMVSFLLAGRFIEDLMQLFSNHFTSKSADAATNE